MEYSEFEKLAAKVVMLHTVHMVDSGGWRNGNKDPRNTNPFICSEYWVTGGMSGGNCYGDEARPIYYADRPKDLMDLDTLLNEINPKITFLQYKQIENLIETQDWTDIEYYGNYTYYCYKYLDLKKMYDKLKELSLI